MKNYIYLLPILFVVVLIFFIILQKPLPAPENQRVNPEDNIGQIANPASTYCHENGGELEIITQKDGSQFGLCVFENHACEEWTFFRGECTLEEDAQKIQQALIAKGLDLSDMKVVIHKHLGNYISGGVVPVSAPAGGGYVFAAKKDGVVHIVADGNGVITCDAFKEYPEFPTYFVPECLDENNQMIAR